jgi:hypothetical protein
VSACEEEFFHCGVLDEAPPIKNECGVASARG